MTRALHTTETAQLWNPARGIRFSPAREPRPLYPQLDVARFVHGGVGAPDPRRDHVASGAADVKPSVGASAGSPNGAVGRGAAAAVEPPVTTGPAREQGCREEPFVDPPHTSLAFNMAADLFRAARAAAPGTDQSYWSHALYRRVTPTGAVEKVQVHYCTSKHAAEQVLREHFLGEHVLGFDLEWLPYATSSSSPRENVSLIQLASPSRIGLFHVARFADTSATVAGDNLDHLVAPTLRQIMDDPAVSKVGVQIRGDCTRLKNVLGVQTRGIFELSHLYKQVTHTAAGTPWLINKVPVALSVQVENYLRLPLYKGESVRSGNWMQRLDERQILYSASDAYAGIQLYHILDAKRRELEPCPPLPHHVELGLPIPLAELAPASEAPSPSELDPTASGTPALAPAPAPKPKPTPKRSRAARPPRPSPPAQVEPPSPPAARDERVAAADLKAKQYRSSKQAPLLATSSALRAYYVWHANDGLRPESIAGLLRDPPLKVSTVVTYILSAIVAEKLPYQVARFRAEILPLLHPTLAAEQYRRLARPCEAENRPRGASP